MPVLPDDLPLRERTAVRAVLVDADGRVLLLEARDPTEPATGRWWDLPGGGIEPGESVGAAAVREVHEETGIRIHPEQVGPPTWRRTATFRYRGFRHLQHESVVVVRLTVSGPPVDGSLREAFEIDDYCGHRWWTPDAIRTTDERFYPGRLPQYIARALAGDEIDEPFERWS